MNLAKKQTNIKISLIYSIVAIIALACWLMNGPMRGGLPLDNTHAERLNFIANNGLLWSLSWCAWMGAAIGLFLFCTILADELQRSYARTAGIALVAMGIAPDLSAEVIYAFVIPKGISTGMAPELLAMLESLAMHLTGFLGNGLYNLGGLLLTWLAVRQKVLVPWVAAWGLAAWLSGLALSAAIAAEALIAAEWLTAAGMVLSTSWMLVFAHRVVRR